MDLPPAKRKKFFTKGEVLERLQTTNCQIVQLSEDICEELCPFDATKEDELIIEDRVDRMKLVTDHLASKVYKLHKLFKEKKFRHHPENLDENIISCSQYSVLQSGSEGDSLKIIDSQDQHSDFSLENSQVQNEASASGDMNSQGPITYKKKPLNQSMTQLTRSRRVSDKRDILSAWADEEGVSATVLLGYLLYLENYHTGMD